MDLDDIKEMWNDEEHGRIEMPTDIKGVKKARGPINKIRRNMKNEFYAQIVAIALLALFPYHFKFRDELINPFFALYAVMLAITAYFFIKYYLFYKQLSNTTLTSKDHLYSLYFDIRVNMEVYKAYSFSLIPFVLIFAGMVILNKKPELQFSSQWIYIAIVIYVAVTVAMGILANAWISILYGKYAKQIKGLVEELKEE